MAYNLMAIARSPINWQAVNDKYRNTDQMFEAFPITDPEYDEAIGISIPMNYFNEKTWNSVSTFLSALATSYTLEVLDMYTGCVVDITTYIPDGLNARE